MELVDVMRGLQAVDSPAAAEARAELVRRGFSEVHLKLAQQLFDPDPEVRKQLARTLPQLQSIDAGPWLLRLTQDEDAEVRLAALTLLATTGDPTMLSRVQEIARQDRDPAVQRTIERLAGRRPVGEGGSAVR
jgi:HEAT repeat protein